MWLPSAAQGWSDSATIRTASAVLWAPMTSAWLNRLRRKLAHWALAWGWDSTRSMDSSGSCVRAISVCAIGCTTSPTICTSSVSKTSASRVALTDPSSEFSIGTSARSQRPSTTAITHS